MRCILSTLLLGLLCGAIAAAESSVLSAQQITTTNARQLIKGGPDAIGGIGDWHLSNGVVCAVISHVGHEHEFSAQGGALIDLGFCGRDDDHFAFTQDLVDGSRFAPFNARSIRTEVEQASASVIVISEASGVISETRYSLNHSEPTRLQINKTMQVVDEELATFNVLSFGVFNYHSLQPFVLATNNLANSRGFQLIDFVTRGVDALDEAAHDANTIVTVSPPDAEAGVAYGWQLQSVERVQNGIRTPLPRFALADEESIAFMILSDTFWIGDGSQISWLQLPQIPLLTLDESAAIESQEVILLGKSHSVASITDQLFADQPLIRGRARETNSALHLIREDGAPFSHLRPEPNGEFSLRAPPGNYRLRHRGSADRVVEHAITVTDQGAELGELRLPEPARLNLPQGEAMRLVFVGLDGTPSPDFVDTLTEFSVYDDDGEHPAERLSQLFLAGVAGDRRTVDLAPGKYRVYATRGLEYSLESTDIEVSAGETTALQITPPKREISTPGRIAADFHVHAGDSFDNTFSNQERVRTFVAEHGEVMVNSEHDVVVDFAPLVEAMSVSDKITAITGVEMTSLLFTPELKHTGGHVNFFPFQPQPLEYRNGMVAHEGKRLRDILHAARQQNPGTIAQLNHPRQNLSLSNGAPENFAELIDDGAYLDHMGIAGYPYNPGQTLQQQPNYTLIDPDPVTGLRDLDIDAMEIINPGGEFHQQRIEAVRRDWMSFLLQGERITGTANSDSHRGSEQVAVPRNMVAVTNDDVNLFSRGEFYAAIKRGDVYGTTGPMLSLNLEGANMGDTISGNQGQLDFSVQAASWIPVQRADIQIDGKTVKSVDLTQQRRWQIPLSFEKDAIVTLEVHGEASPEYATIYHGIQPYAFSNPIYVDANADGIWAPPLGGINQEVIMNQHEKINYLEYHAKNIAQTKAFFESVFNWQFTDYGPDYTAFDRGAGLDGGFHKSELSSSAENGAALTVLYSNDLEATQAKVEAAGGEISTAIFDFPGGRRFHFIEPSGNEFAVWSDK